MQPDRELHKASREVGRSTKIHSRPTVFNRFNQRKRPAVQPVEPSFLGSTHGTPMVADGSVRSSIVGSYLS